MTYSFLSDASSACGKMGWLTEDSVMVSASGEYSQRAEYSVCFKTNSIRILWCFLLMDKIGGTEKKCIWSGSSHYYM